tara:strand:+ start:2069 stop:2317 length:249 start_codon:yes stop_codon:yes gene_type:complete
VPIDRPIDACEGLPLEMPLVYFHGDVSPGNNPMLYKARSPHTGSHTTASAWCTPFLKDFARRITPPASRFQSRHTSTPFNST